MGWTMMEQCVLLVGGRGTRLGALTEATPKPLLPVAGRPFIEYLIERAAAFGVGEVVLLTGYLGEQFDGYHHSRHLGTRVRCVREPAPLGTGGALRAAPGLAESFVLMNGDTFFDVDPKDLADLPAPADWLGKMALRRLAATPRSGVVTLSGSRITAFAERGDGGPGLINGGIYVLRRAVLAEIGDGPCSLEGDVLPRLAAAGRLHGKAYDGYFIDIGIPADLARAQTEMPVGHPSRLA